MNRSRSKYLASIFFNFIIGFAFLYAISFLGAGITACSTSKASNLGEADTNQEIGAQPKGMKQNMATFPMRFELSKNDSELNPNAGISREDDAVILPSPPGNIIVYRQKDGSSIVEWQDIGLEIVRFYKIYRKCPSGNWKVVAKVSAVNPTLSYYHYRISNGDGCLVAISVEDQHGNEGKKSETILLK
jgi:hypothetical protein